MKLWKEWGLLFSAWVISTIAIRLWPSIDKLDVELKPDLLSAVLYKPFHYLSAVLFMIFFILIISTLFQKLVYECKVSYLLKKFSMSIVLLFILLLSLYIKMVLFFPYLVLTLTAIVLIYEVLAYWPRRKEEVTYVRE